MGVVAVVVDDADDLRSLFVSIGEGLEVDVDGSDSDDEDDDDDDDANE